MATSHVRAPAKINLALSVGPPEGPSSPRPGWHPIASWMAAIDLCDELTVESLSPAQPSTLDVRFADDAPSPSPIDWPPAKDLAFRAIAALEARVGRPLPTRIQLLKRIPVGAGLGGGSSNAASTLIALNQAHALRLSIADLARLGASLGSDVPFFLDEHAGHPDGSGGCMPPRPALVTHFGDRIERLPSVHGELLLVVPRFGCPTQDVYRAFDTLHPRAFQEHAIRALANHHVLEPERLFNDLTPAACLVRPDLSRLLSHIRSVAGLPAHLTGSGSGIFILTPPERSHALAAHLPQDPLLRDCALIATRFADPRASEPAP